MSHGIQYKTPDIVAALHKTHGAVYLAAELIGCSHKTVERRAKKVREVAEVINKYRGRRLDVAELALDKALADNQAWAIQFVLRTQGRTRGYVERQEITGIDGAPVMITEIEVVKDYGK
jgi:hypothetical protein